ncbi:MAG: hypothetical protein R2851_07085 [Caldilineaceae bacterium]
MLLAGPDFLTGAAGNPLRRSGLRALPGHRSQRDHRRGRDRIRLRGPGHGDPQRRSACFLEYAVTDAGAEALASIALEQDWSPRPIQGLENIPDQLLGGRRLVSQANGAPALHLRPDLRRRLRTVGSSTPCCVR